MGSAGRNGADPYAVQGGGDSGGAALLVAAVIDASEVLQRAHALLDGSLSRPQVGHTMRQGYRYSANGRYARQCDAY
jgi:hypothetical protein